MRLTAIGINRRSSIAQGTDKLNILIRIPLEGIEVVIDKDGIRVALISQLKGLDQPVIARFATTSKSRLDVLGVILMSLNGLIHHVNHV